jgi:hypothetical protein
MFIKNWNDNNNSTKKKGKEEEGVGRWEEFRVPSPSLAHYLNLG